jgi:class 3 adenylate cyclase
MSHHTFIFSDLVGFTALTEANGDDRAAELAHDFYPACAQCFPSTGRRR